MQRKDAGSFLDIVGLAFNPRRDRAVEAAAQLVRQPLVGRVAQQGPAKPQVPVGLLVEEIPEPRPRGRSRQRVVAFFGEPRQHLGMERQPEHRRASHHVAVLGSECIDARHRRGFGRSR